MDTAFLNGWPPEVDITFRLLLAYLLGGVVGWEREANGQVAGLRTHLLVACGSASFTLLFIFGFKGLSTNFDVGRAASQIIVGIGFLGAGVIWQKSSRVPQRHGLTTAADIWVVAAIGMAAGTGMWYVAMLLTFLTYMTLHFLRSVEVGIALRKHKKQQQTKQKTPNPPQVKP